MHVLILPSWYPDRATDIAGCFFREQALALKSAGCDVGVISPHLRSWWNPRDLAEGASVVAFECDEGVNTYRHRGLKPLPLMPVLRQYYWRYFALKLFCRYVERHGVPDIIHVHSMLYAGAATLRISRKYGIPYVVTEHSTAFARGLISSKQRSIMYAVAQSAHKRFAVSSPFAGLLNDFFGPKCGSWEVMPNIVHGSFLDRRSKQAEVQCDTIVFSCLGLLTAKKGIDLIVEAFARAFRHDPAKLLRIGGDGLDRVRLERLVTDLGMSDQVTFLGHLGREQVVEYLRDTDIFVLGSRYETFGVVVAEALAMGKPVIATRCGGPEDLVTSADGLTVPVGDVQAMSEAMQYMSENYLNYRPRVISQSCEARFGERVIGFRLLACYRQVLASHSSGLPQS